MKRGLSLIFLSLILLSTLVLAAETNASAFASSNTALEKEVELPAAAEFFARIFLGIKPEEPVTSQVFVVLVVCFIIFFLILKDIISLVPFLQESWKRWIGALIITSLVGLSRGLIVFAMWVTDLMNAIEFLTRTKVIGLIILFLLLFVILMLFNMIKKTIEMKIRPEIAKEQGYQEGIIDRLSRMVIKKVLGSKVPV